MTKDEFVKLCVSSGYAKKKFAEDYAKDKNVLTDDDFINVYRKQEEQISSKWDLSYSNPKYLCNWGSGGKTTKRLKQSYKMGSDRVEEDEL